MARHFLGYINSQCFKFGVGWMGDVETLAE
jgi:hypothetical protein